MPQPSRETGATNAPCSDLPGQCRILTAREKKTLTRRVFNAVDFRNVDLSDADLRGTQLRFVNLQGSDLSSADLREASWLGCDLGSARLTGARFGANCFDGCNFAHVQGLSDSQRRYIEERGGSFRPSSPNGHRRE